jgi:hypothetical protein
MGLFRKLPFATMRGLQDFRSDEERQARKSKKTTKRKRQRKTKDEDR